MTGANAARSAKRIIATPEPSASPRLAVTLTVDEFDERITIAVARAFSAHAPEPEYRDSDTEAARLGISRPTLDRLVRQGLPHVYVGDSRRFRAGDVDAWLDTRSRERVQLVR